MRCRICERSGIHTNNSKFKEVGSLCKSCLELCGLLGVTHEFVPRYNTKRWS